MKCHSCGIPLTNDTPGLLEDTLSTQTYVKPCLYAPLICGLCRKDPKKLKAARVAMEEHFASSCPGGEKFTIEKREAA